MKKLFFLLSFFCISAMVTFAQNVEKIHYGLMAVKLELTFPKVISTIGLPEVKTISMD